MARMRFDEAFLGTFGRAHDRAFAGAIDARARAEESDRADVRLERRFEEDRARQEAALDQADKSLTEQNRRFDEAEKNRATREQLAMEAAAKRYDEDRKERAGDRAATRDDQEYQREYARSIAAFQNAEPAEGAARVRPLFAKASQGGALTPREKAELDAGRDAYAMLRKMAATPRTIEQTVKGTDPTDPTRELFQKVRVPDPTWKPVALPTFEEAMMPEAAKFMSTAPINPGFGTPKAPEPAGAMDQIFKVQQQRREAAALEKQKQQVKDAANEAELNRMRAQDYGQWMT